MGFSDIDALIADVPRNNQVYKDECAFTFAAPDDEAGIYICLRNFLGVGPEIIEKYVNLTDSHVFLQYRIVKTLKSKGMSRFAYNLHL